MKLWKEIWQDERGFVSSTELILLTTLAVIGLVVGLTTWRDAAVQELGDSAAAVGQLNQSYAAEVQANPSQGISVSGDQVTFTREFGDDGMGNPVVVVEGSFNNFDYVDQSDVGDGADTAGSPPAGITLGIAPTNEGT